MALTCYILRANRTFKKKKFNLKRDDFDFEGGKYYIDSDRIYLMKDWFRYQPVLIFKEGISQPIGFQDIKKRQIKDADGKLIDDDTVLIDARSIHRLTSESILGFLTKSPTKTLLTIILVALVMNILISLVGVVGV